MGRFARVIDRTIYCILSGPNDIKVVLDCVDKLDRNGLTTGYISAYHTDIFYVRLNGDHHVKRQASKIGSALAENYQYQTLRRRKMI